MQPKQTNKQRSWNYKISRTILTGFANKESHQWFKLQHYYEYCYVELLLRNQFHVLCAHPCPQESHMLRPFPNWAVVRREIIISIFQRSGLVAHGDCHHFWLCFWVSTADIIEVTKVKVPTAPTLIIPSQPHLYRCPDGEIFSVNGHKCALESANHTCQPSEIPPPANVPVLP